MFKKLLAIFFAVIMGVSFSTLPASAAILEWDGISELTKGNTYKVTSELIIKNDFTIPKGVKISVREGGSLILRGSELSVKILGNLSIGNEGALELRRGAITVAPDAVLDVYGEYLQYVGTELNISGKFTGYNSSDIKISGDMIIYKTGELYLRGKLIQTGASSIGISGSVQIEKRAEMRIEGSLSITLSGNLINGGYLSISKIGTVVNSGTFHLKSGSNYNRFGALSNTKSAIFIDNRDTHEYETMTTAILADEPAVEIRGIDVSYAQGDIDWEKVAETDTEFAIIRAGRGSFNSSPMKEDDYYRQNMEGAIANGIDVGVYFYSYATTVEEAIAEAEFYVSIIDGYEITYPVILDLEEEIEHLNVELATEMVEAFFKVLMDNGYYPMLYSFKYWFEEYLDMQVLDTYAIWLSQLDKVTYQGGYYLWQYSHTGKVNGINGDVPLDISYIDFPALLRRYKLNNL